VKNSLVTLYYGADYGRLDKAVIDLRTKLQANTAGEFNTDRLDGRDGGCKVELIRDLIAKAADLPMMATHRLIQLRGMDRLTKEANGLLAKYLEKPWESCYLLLVSGEQLDGRGKLSKVLKKKWVVREFKPPKDPEAYSVFDLGDSVGCRDLQESLARSKRLTRDEAPLKQLFMLARHLRMLWKYKAHRLSGVSSAQATRLAGAPAFVASKFEHQSSLWTLETFHQAIYFLSLADSAMKRSRLDATIILDNLLVNLCTLG